MKRDVFISYSSKDRKTAEKVYTLLEKKGIRCWIAPRDVTPGQIYAKEILSAIENCSVVVLILSEHSNESIHVSNEIERAGSKRKPIFTVRVRDVQPSMQLELYISSYQWIDAWGLPFVKNIDTLHSAILAVIEKRSKAPIIDSNKQILKENRKTGQKKRIKLFPIFLTAVFVAISCVFLYLRSEKHANDDMSESLQNELPVNNVDSDKNSTPITDETQPIETKTDLTKKMTEGKNTSSKRVKPPEKKYGRLRIRVEKPHAMVFLDDRKKGISPIDLESVETGEHELLFVFDQISREPIRFKIIVKEHNNPVIDNEYIQNYE